MNSNRQDLPFKTLGQKLKTLREKLHESVAEVSGAVEIDEQTLTRFEQGQERPSQDILMLLINHFDIPDDDADKLWHLAGYEHNDDDTAEPDIPNNRTMVMIMAVDPRITYSDGVNITANSQGVVLNFSQGGGTPHALTTARVGMSREQAANLLNALQRALHASEPRQLPPSTSSEQK